jgi:hypothetical protein
MSDAKDQAFQSGNRLAEPKTNAFPQRMTFVVRSFQDEKFVNVTADSRECRGPY